MANITLLSVSVISVSGATVKKCVILNGQDSIFSGMAGTMVTTGAEPYHNKRIINTLQRADALATPLDSD